MENIRIEKIDNMGRGICYIDNKITFVPNTLPGELVNINITKESKKYNEGIVTKYLETSPDRVESLCPYFDSCGGCALLNTSYSNTLKYKKEKLESIILKYSGLKLDINVIESPNDLHYRNKITLKIKNNEYGYYISETHKLVKIDDCLLAEQSISDFIKDIKYLGIKDGELVIRTNYLNELLLVIDSKTKPQIDIDYLTNNHKIKGIILNNKLVYGESSFKEVINHLIFNVSYDSFFQVNREICRIIFDKLNEYIDKSKCILDLYSGVGTLGISVSHKVDKVYSLEIVKNATLNGISNAKLNDASNIYFMLGKVEDNIKKIKDEIDTIILDPPRAGLDKVTRDFITRMNPQKIIYISCDPMTLARDLKELSLNYKVKEVTGLDMFPYTYHIETMCLLEKR
jgi:23S rRNA (uracil1939-C5)-methyltransferase